MRLAGRNAYTAVFTFKCSVSGALFELYARPNGMSRARFGIVVSKRLMRHAVRRNYCKRLAREVLRRECAACPGLDIVLRARAVLSRTMFARAQTEISGLVGRVQRKCGVRVAAIETERT